jgi:glycine cleavage system H protein
VEINEVLSDEPGVVNDSPEKSGWFIKIEMEDEGELGDLMSPDTYKTHCEEEAH